MLFLCFFGLSAYLVWVVRLKDMAGHLGLRVVGLASDQIGEVGEVITIVNEPGDVLSFMLENEYG